MAGADPIELQENEPRLPWRYVAAGVSVLLFVALVAVAYKLGTRDIANNAVPFVRADGEPVKVRPVEPGGTVFTNADLGTVYERRHAAAQSTEVLAPEAERPVVPSPEAAVSANAPAVENSGVVQKTDASAEKAPEKISEKAPEKSNAPAVAATPAPVAAIPSLPTLPSANASAPEPVAPVRVKPVVVAPAAPADLRSVEKIITALDQPNAAAVRPIASGGTHASIQLASVRSRPDAEQLVAGYKERFGSILGTEPSITRVDLGGRGIYYRVRVAYADAAKAKQVCNTLRTRGVSCIPLGE